MRFTHAWLMEHLQSDASLEEIVAAMTMAGLEVEDVTDPARGLAQFTAARVLDARPHPNADRLQVCRVETVDGEKEIVCGGLNARAGLVTAYAPVGAYIPGSGVTLAARPVRGVVSNGMLCSGSEMQTEEDPFGLRAARYAAWEPRVKALGLDRETAIADGGIIELPDSAAVGAPVSGLLGLADPVIDFEVTPNRPDWLGVVGIARDLAAKGLGRFTFRPAEPVEGRFDCPVEIRLEATQACPVFAGRVIRGVRNGPSPDWMQKRLRAVGINPKSLLVDVTNYVSLDRARPLHVYDLARLKGAVRVRLGRTGDRFEALDGETYEPGEDMCVIADDTGAIGFGGVMGGASTGVSEGTTDVFIESAWFDPLRTARTGRSTGILSDARFRFERGVDPLSHTDGIEFATRLILDHGGGEPSAVRTAGAPPPRRETVVFRLADMARLTGVDMPAQRMEVILRSLGFDPILPPRSRRRVEAWPVAVPSFRPDVEGSADIVEELIRIEGFDALPDSPLPPLPRDSRIVVTPLQNRVRIARRVAAARGFLEAVTWSFMAKDKAARMLNGANALDPALVIDNPIASDLDYMRPSPLAHLAEAAQRNTDRGVDDVRLFEAGPAFGGDRPGDQRTVLSAVVLPRAARHWAGGRPPYDAFAAKADVEAVLAAIDYPADRLMVGEPDGPHWHPGRSATLRMGPKVVAARFGELHPAFLKSLGVDGPMAAFEIVLDALPAPRAKSGKTRAPFEAPDQTPVKRDFAFVVPEAVAAGDIVRLAAKADPKRIASVGVFDVYRGSGVPEGMKSVAVEVTIQPRGAALTDAEIETLAAEIVRAVGKGTGATLRA